MPINVKQCQGGKFDSGFWSPLGSKGKPHYTSFGQCRSLSVLGISARCSRNTMLAHSCNVLIEVDRWFGVVSVQPVGAMHFFIGHGVHIGNFTRALKNRPLGGRRRT